MSWISGDFLSRKRVYDDVDWAIGDRGKTFKDSPKISKIVVDYLEEFPCFGECEWTTLIGRVDPAPSLPPDFSDIWNGPCPIYRGKKLSETHMLVYIPATIDGKPFTLNKLGKIAKRFFPKNKNGYGYIWPAIFDELGNEPTKSRWVLMTKNVLPGSRDTSYAEQQRIIDSLARKSLSDYKVPDTLEAATCILTQFFLDWKTRLFNDNPWTFTRCKDKIENSQVVVGVFDSTGLSVCNGGYDNDHIGIAALREI